MKDFTVSILGNGSAVPTAYQNPSSQLVKYKSLRFLVDCGEGTQMQFIKYGFSYKNLSHIFISHLHGDHYLGLAGLISTFHLFGRKNPLHVYGPAPLEPIIMQQFLVSDTHLQFELIFHHLEGEQLLYDDPQIQVLSFPLKHSVPTWGFRFQEKENSEKRLDKDFVSRYRPKIAEMRKIKRYRKPWIVAFTFGLLHGLGFAAALSQIGLPDNAVPLALALFNVGVEIGQLIFVFAFIAVGWALSRVNFNPPVAWSRAPAYFIGALASFWLIERTVGFFI